MNNLSDNTLCPGHKCPERDDCLRWLRSTTPGRTNWASLDIERRLFGDCPAKLVSHVHFFHRGEHRDRA